MSRYAHITRAILRRPWAIDPDSVAWAAILDVLAIRAAGGMIPDEEISARIEAASNGPRSGRTRAGNVAVIPVYGVISPRQNMMSQTSGGTTAEQIGRDVRAAVADEDVAGIVLDVDSPGGSVEGMDELAATIREARAVKPVVAHAQHLMASAAYWLGSAADEIVGTPSATVGSIGVFAAHQDVSAAMEAEGIRTTLVSAGKYKVEGNQYEPLSDEARSSIQSDVDEFYSMMVASIAKNRGVSAAVVRSDYGEGRGVLAKAALTRGMLDRIDHFDNTLRRVAVGKVKSRDGAAIAAAAGGMHYVAVESSGLPAHLSEDTLGQPDVDEPESPEQGDAAESGEPPPAVAIRQRADLEVLEAAMRGGYRLPDVTQ